MGNPTTERGQLEALNRLLSELVPANRFYNRKIETSGFRLPVSGLADFFASFPLTTKSELIEDQGANPPYGTNLTYPLKAYTRYHQTSGTSGKPIRWLDTPESWQWMKGNWQTVYEAAKVTEGDVLLFAFSFGPFLGFWTAFEAAADRGCRCLPGGGLSTLARLRLIVENGVQTVCCTPTYALRLGEAAAEDRAIDLSSVESLIVAGEPGAGIAEVRARIERLWPCARLFDHHGMTEVGPVSYTRPESPEILRLIEAAYIAEILDPNTLRPVAAGQAGELVLTTLGRLGSPLLRYRTGDLVRRADDPDEGLSCYRLRGGILGRIDDMILVRGVNVYPAAVENVVRRFEEIVEFRVTVCTRRNMWEMSIEIEPAPGCSRPHALARELEEELKSALALRVPVQTVDEGGLPRFEMKARRWHKS